MNTEIPTEFHIAWLDQTFQIHWNYHAWMMVVCWFVLVPFGVISIRYFKTKPVPQGLPRAVGKFDPLFVWWIMHIWTLYAAITLSLLGMAVALITTGKFSGSLHSWFGGLTVVFGTLQIVVAWQRGSHGGHNHRSSDPADPATWRGDHFDMTPRRRWFEAYHKPGGYFTLFLATGAVTTGLMQFWMPVIAVILPLLFVGLFALVVILEGSGQRHDTYEAVFGNDPNIPGNRMRKQK